MTTKITSIILDPADTNVADWLAMNMEEIRDHPAPESAGVIVICFTGLSPEHQDFFTRKATELGYEFTAWAIYPTDTNDLYHGWMSKNFEAMRFTMADYARREGYEVASAEAIQTPTVH